MSGQTDETRTVANLQPAPPFANGNEVARKSGFYSAVLASSEREEIAAIADALRSLSPIDSDAAEPLIGLAAAQLWRRNRAVEYIEEQGLETVSKAGTLLRDLTTLERALLETLRALALTPQSAADLGLTLARTRASGAGFDVSRLSDEERHQLDSLLERAKTNV